MKYVVIIVFALSAAACGGEENTQEDAPKQDVSLAQSQNSTAFNDNFTSFLNNYYHLKDAFVLSNNELATTSAKLLAASADSINLSEVKADSSIVEMAKGYVQTVSAEASALAGENDLEAKRKSFQMISDAMYDLIRTVHFDQQVVYHQFCPMAFNDAGAYWLSSAADIKNPYFGKKMLTCGEVKDSIDFRSK